MSEDKQQKTYRGRIAPTPSGYLHEGHASTFKVAWNRARESNGDVVYRNDDLDKLRCKSEFLQAAMQDLKSLTINWDEGPDCGGKYGPYNQSERADKYTAFLLKLANEGFVYPCEKSRKEIQSFGNKSRVGNEYLFPQELRPVQKQYKKAEVNLNTNWRFRTQCNEKVSFVDGRKGKQSFEIGKDFADFLVWRKDGVASYELATVVDDHLMEITEIVRGEDLLISSARQCKLFDSLNWVRPDFYHCELLVDISGKKLSKSERNLPRLIL
ncbi:MAG: glutamate--tRNA ligase family protein [Opitutales bacterium]|nr:glutamate--tRNA ligase family protein [Opitutales bacterium]